MGDKLSFSPYMASNIDKDFMTSSTLTLVSYEDESRSQSYSYDFKGKSSWKANCEMGGKSQAIGAGKFKVSD